MLETHQRWCSFSHHAHTQTRPATPYPAWMQAEIEALDTVGSAADLPDLLLRCLEEGDCV